VFTPRIDLGLAQKLIPNWEDDFMAEGRILIIDDEPLIRRAMADYLIECGYETSMAADGAEGLSQARAEHFDIVLVDLHMPRVGGLEVITTLRAESPELPVVVVSGTGVLADAIEAMRQGAWDYITKPVRDIDEILVVVERVLDQARLIAERDRYRREIEEINRSLEAEVTRRTDDLWAQNRELAALNRVSYVISDPLDLDTMLNRAIDAALVATNADAGVVRLLNPATNQLVIAVARGLAQEYVSSAQAIPFGEGVVGRVAQSGHARGGGEFASDPWMALMGEATRLQSYLCVPLRTGKEIVGTLAIFTQAKHTFEAREVELVASIGNQIGVAVGRAQYAEDLRRVNAQLEHANAELRRLDVLREQFIQNVAHELRTPLALVHGYVEMLTQEDLGADEQQMALSVTSRRVRALVDLVESITTLQDLDSEPLRFEPVVPIELIQTACQMTSQRAANADVELHNLCPPDLPAFSGDFTRLAQALHQLLDNACKFSPEGSEVTVNLEMTQDAVFIIVVDQGVGIPPEEQSRIFDRFYQVDGSMTRRYGGTGLGLAIAKEVIETHAGNITLESTPGEGSVFTVRLPYVD
jgi:signal transduction histidine kinase/DNA-binding response OmpR family regulator